MEIGSENVFLNPPKYRVELHVHLDGAIRPETIWALMTQKKVALPGDGSLSALQHYLAPRKCTTLTEFLKPFSEILAVVQGDLEVIERIAKEFVEDKSRDDVAYCEVRFSPHLMLAPGGGDGAPTSDQIVEAVLRGLAEGERGCPGTQVRVLLVCMRGMKEHFDDVLRLCEVYKDKGVVGMDIAGTMSGEDFSEGAEVFQAAQAKGIHRTVHAGEDAGPESVKVALQDLRAERIGHGYRVLEDEDLYEICKETDVHFEVCPYSSYYTGAMKSLQLPSKRHPVIRFAEDDVSFSINTDDPTLTGSTLSDETQLLRSWGFNDAVFAKANFNAALHSFLPPAEKQALLAQLRSVYGVADFTPPAPTTATTNGVMKSAPVKPNITFNTWANRA